MRERVAGRRASTTDKQIMHVGLPSVVAAGKPAPDRRRSPSADLTDPSRRCGRRLAMRGDLGAKGTRFPAFGRTAGALPRRRPRYCGVEGRAGNGRGRPPESDGSRRGLGLRGGSSVRRTRNKHHDLIARRGEGRAPRRARGGGVGARGAPEPGGLRRCGHGTRATRTPPSPMEDERKT